MDTISKGYKFRIYPTQEQIAQINRTFGCCRYVYNHFLQIRSFTYQQKKGLEYLDERMKDAAFAARLTSIIQDEQGHFEVICNQRADYLRRDLLLFKNFVPDVYAAYWSWALAHGHAKRNVKVPGFYDTSKALTELKQIRVDEDGTQWLYCADAVALVYELRNLDNAFNLFFKRVERAKKEAEKKKSKKKAGEKPTKRNESLGYPRFKRAGQDRCSYKTTAKNISIDYEHNTINVPKLGTVKCVLHRKVEGRPVSVVISRDSADRYFASIGCQDVPHPEKVRTGRETAVEIGVTHAAVTSDGQVYDKPRNYERFAKRLELEERRLSFMVGAKEGETPSKRYLKQKKKVAKIHARIADARKDNLHNISKKIAMSNDVIVLRKNNVADMLEKKGEDREVPREVEKKMNRNLSDASMYELARQITYKSEWFGNEVILVPNEFASTKTCSHCGYVNDELDGVKGLSIRKWTCPNCGTFHDRELNSATNLLVEGRRIANLQAS